MLFKKNNQQPAYKLKSMHLNEKKLLKKWEINKEKKIINLINNELLQTYKFEGIRIHIVEPDSTQIRVIK